jgi:methionine sulfoxide reductase heme-binding subunit
LRFLPITLAVTPNQRFLGLPDLIRFRRIFGMFASFCTLSHMTIWLALDKAFDLSEMRADVV